MREEKTLFLLTRPSRKSEIRISKSEASTKFETLKDNASFVSLGFRICFGFRASIFGFLPRVLPQKFRGKELSVLLACDFVAGCKEIRNTKFER